MSLARNTGFIIIILLASHLVVLVNKASFEVFVQGIVLSPGHSVILAKL